MTAGGPGGVPPEAVERFRRADAILDAALDLAPDARAAFVAHATRGDAALAADVARLLRAGERAGAFLAATAAEDAAPLLAAASDEALAARLQRALGDAYAIGPLLGAGGMARVFLARDVRHARDVAVKVFDAASASALAGETGAQRFLAEIRITAGLVHPNILPLFDSGADGDLRWYIMPRVAGESLRRRLERERPLPPGEALRLVRAIAGAVAHAHAHGVVHRDLKPENVLLQDGQPLVADFGVALATSGTERLTGSGIAVGTPPYMSPEQAAGDRVDARTDVYALGVIAHELLTGEAPPPALPLPLLVSQRRAAAPPPRARGRAARAIARALAPFPADRWPTARAFADALGTGDAPVPRWAVLAGIAALLAAWGVVRLMQLP